MSPWILFLQMILRKKGESVKKKNEGKMHTLPIVPNTKQKRE